MAKRDSRHTHILLRGEGAGAITKADIQRRARELALIRDGTENVTDEDVELARRELFGDEAPAATTDDQESDVFISRDPAEPRGVHGHQRPEVAPEESEENDQPEHLAIQGVEEAQHDQMVESRRREQEQDREEETDEPADRR